MNKTSEFISPMHPDKLCDRISDAILDDCLKHDPNSRCAIETMGGHDQVFITGELTTTADVNLEKIVERIVGKKLKVTANIVQQSSEIANGVDTGGAGDQGIMVGYACRENEAMIPQEHYLARSLCRYLYELHPDDGKTQVTLGEKDIAVAIVASWRGVSNEQLKEEVIDWISKQNLRVGNGIQIYCNSAGDWEQGGFDADTGLTGRKIVVDAYGTRIPVGGGAFSGKDWTKVDRSGAYRARQLALHLLKTNDVKDALVQVAYAIGEPHPTQVSVIFNGDLENDITEKYRDFFVPARMKQELDLDKPIFEETAKWGHFGNGFAWDQSF
jgi:S-adenosylmethionine synthetase